MEWKLKKFNELTNWELYSILQLRSEVFIVEQNCVYLDLDGKDATAWHLMGMINEKLAAYTRLLPPGISYDDPSIGRVVTSKSERGAGIGRRLMHESIEHCKTLFGERSITLGAQVYLQKFYESLGFMQIGKEYIEDGIPHIRMTRKFSS